MMMMGEMQSLPRDAQTAWEAGFSGRFVLEVTPLFPGPALIWGLLGFGAAP